MQNQKAEMFRFLPKNWVVRAQELADRAASLLIKLKISPNLISILGLLAGLGAGLLFFFEHPLWAGFSIFICGVFDALDGKVAIKTNRQSSYGAILDSSLDRYSEFFIYLGLALHFQHHWAMWTAFLSFFGSAMVSYTRARAEGLGFECSIGMMQRAERIIFLALGAVLGVILKIFNITMIVVLLLIALFSHITAFQRIYHVKKEEKLRITKKEA